MSYDPFGRGPISPLDEFLRRERERREMFDRVLRPSQTIKELVDRHSAITRFASPLGASDMSAGVLEAMRRQEETRKALSRLMTPSWAAAVRDTALTTSRFHDEILQPQRDLARAFDTGIVQTLKKIRSHESAFSAAIAASKWQDKFRSLADRIAPNFNLLVQGAERVRMYDALTLRASAHTPGASSVQIAAEQVIEAHRLFEAIVQADTPEESAKLFASMLAALAALFDHFKENTIEELRKCGLLGLIALLSALLALWPANPAPETSPAEQQAFVEIRGEIEGLSQRLEAIQQAEAAHDSAYVSSLPRAELSRNAVIRREPNARGAILLRAPAMTPVAVVRDSGAWKLVAYRDPLTEQLAQGWVYGRLVRLLDGSQH